MTEFAVYTGGASAGASAGAVRFTQRFTTTIQNATAVVPFALPAGAAAASTAFVGFPAFRQAVRKPRTLTASAILIAASWGGR